MRDDPKSLYRALTRSALSSGQPTQFTEQLLRRRGLDERFETEPEVVLAELHKLRTTHDPDRMFALAELSFLHGERSQKREYYTAAAVYAYAFLVNPERRTGIAPAADPRVRLAADLYNVGMTLGLTVPPPTVEPGQTAPPDEVVLTDRTLDLPFGKLELRQNPDELLWGGYRMSRFIPVIEYRVRGLRNRYRQPGIGVPLAAEVTPVGNGADAEAARKRIPPRVKVPVTVFVRLDKVLENLDAGQIRGTIQVYPMDVATTVEAEGVTLPLELDPSAALAYGLEGAPVWDSEIAGFLRADTTVFGDGLIFMHPYRAGRIPLVLVHGTASSPARWAEIVNEVQNDPQLRGRVQVWLFMYNTSNPVLLSASRLRDSLATAVRDLDPEGKDPALKHMIVMGHSQGGMLTRLMVTDSGDRFWSNVSDTPLDEMKLKPETRELLRHAIYFKPSPYVTRVVFMATPHRGSYLVTSFVLNLVRRFVTLPVTLVKQFAELEQDQEIARQLKGTDRRLPTAVDNMLPGHPFVKTLSEGPIAPGIPAHSIIAVDGIGDLINLNDGVVAYKSAHIDGVESEKVVKSSHSMQAHPDTLLEVRRILRLHLESSPK